MGITSKGILNWPPHKKQNPERYIVEPYGATRSGNYLLRIKVYLTWLIFQEVAGISYI